MFTSPQACRNMKELIILGHSYHVVGAMWSQREQATRISSFPRARQKSSLLQIIEPLTEKSWGRDCVINFV